MAAGEEWREGILPKGCRRENLMGVKTCGSWRCWELRAFVDSARMIKWFHALWLQHQRRKVESRFNVSCKEQDLVQSSLNTELKNMEHQIVERGNRPFDPWRLCWPWYHIKLTPFACIRLISPHYMCLSKCFLISCYHVCFHHCPWQCVYVAYWHVSMDLSTLATRHTEPCWDSRSSTSQPEHEVACIVYVKTWAWNCRVH